MSAYGDAEPEDAYDASDRLEDRLGVIVRILQARDADDDAPRRARRTAELVRLLDVIEGEVIGWRVYVADLLDRAVAG